MVDGIPEEISSATNIDPTKSIRFGNGEQSNRSRSFDTFMRETGPQGPDAKMEGPSPFDLVAQGKVADATGPTYESVLGQMNSTASVLGDLQNQLSDKNLNLRQSQKYLLRNKLANVHQNIKTVAQKTGTDTGLSVPQFNHKNPVNKFLGLLADSQNQLSNAQTKIKGFNSDGISMNPGDLLSVQLKLAKAQQELEYCSVLLTTVVSDIKTLFNIQL
ncbi:MAG: hypothetical protein AAGE99_04490 [Chlamydiota bacterium]